MDDTLFGIGIFALFIFGGVMTYTMSERKHRLRWRRYTRREVAPASEPFRRNAGPPVTKTVLAQARSPKAIRRTALWSFYMGQMAVPGGLLGMLGLLFGGLGLVSIPGMILAIRIWRHGFWMLRNDPRAEDEARKLSHFALILNAVAMVIAMALMPVDLIGVSVVLIAYGFVSFAHAGALQRCASLLAEDRIAREAFEAEIAAEAAAAHPTWAAG